MKSFNIPVSFNFIGTVNVKADTEEEALKILNSDFSACLGEISAGSYDEEIHDWNIDMKPETNFGAKYYLFGDDAVQHYSRRCEHSDPEFLADHGIIYKAEPGNLDELLDAHDGSLSCTEIDKTTFDLISEIQENER